MVLETRPSNSNWLQESARFECGRNRRHERFTESPLVVELTNINKGRKPILRSPYINNGCDKPDKRTEILEPDRV